MKHTLRTDDFTKQMNDLGVERLSVHEATVTGYNRRGCYVVLTDVNVPCFYHGSGVVGDRVLVSILRISEEHHDITCGLDSILEYAPIVA